MTDTGTMMIIDTETTGLYPESGHKVIEICALEMSGKTLTGRKLHYYLNPERNVPDEAYRIHGISTEFLKDKPKFSEIADEFLSFIENTTLVIHNAVFDIGFINYELSRINKPSLNIGSAIDTLSMARKMFPGQKNNLDALCKRFSIDNSDRKFHGALKDCILLADVYVELTGGRQQIFAFNTSFTEQKTETMKSRSHNISQTKVIYPDNEELRLHKELLTKISG